MWLNQDILTRKTLGYGVKWGKLYYLELAEIAKHNFGQACHTSGIEKAKEKIWLSHRRLGHISFAYLKTLRPNFQREYRCYDPQNKKLYVILDVSFHENEPYYGGGVSSSTLCEENVSEALEPNKQDTGIPLDQGEFLDLRIARDIE
ncbi:hypothetical protein KY290_027557 [Solanum tuberosum]|uniref:GAG-pre-integrase domain-containing protein n=1 Tax=Solanum tuberosum TaxID=4113 RepID=A0ABQ7UFD1_SOLTU|nr:hypothetical protein KY285_029070 [Solanum tuberosum]KAH0748325.1 hypothetical protein KY290_027557 [Solanum tuberosum]